MTIPHLIARAARWHREQVAVVDGERRLTFGEVDARSNRLANALLHLSPAPAARVALLLPNRLEFVEADFAIAKAGKVKVPINPRLSDGEREYILANSGAETLIFDESFRPFVEGARDRLPALRHLIALGREGQGVHEYEGLLAKGADSCPELPLAPEAPSFILYTSGTSGRPKGAMSSQRGRLAATMNMLADELDARPGDGMVHAASTTHGSGSKILAHFLRGARNILLRKFEPELFFWTVERHGATGSFMVPTMVTLLVEAPSRGRYRLGSLRTITYGGAPFAPDKLRAALDAFGPIFVQVYGSCEAPHPVTVLRKEDHLVPPGSERRLASAGREATGVEVRIVARSGEDAKDGDPGELWLKGDNVMLGYWEDPAASREVLQDGYYRSGDVGWRDEDGFIYIVDRERDLIISGGYNIYPAEIEAALSAHPSVLEAAVIGVPDDVWGESVKAFVALRPGAAVSEAELIDHCRRQLAGYKKPRSVEFMESLPKGSTGKILKRVLREPHWRGRAREVN